VPTAPPAYQMVSGAPGTVLSTAKVESTSAAVLGSLEQYYRDTTTPTEQQCSGDAFQYGASGATVNTNVPCTDPTQGCADTLTSTRRMTFLAPGTTAATATKVSDQNAAPLTVSFAGFNP
jgi:hypothetical protein